MMGALWDSDSNVQVITEPNGENLGIAVPAPNDWEYGACGTYHHHPQLCYCREMKDSFKLLFHFYSVFSCLEPCLPNTEGISINTSNQLAMF